MQEWGYAFMNPSIFDEHAKAIAERQYMQPGDGDVFGIFRRVANWVALPEAEENREAWAETFYEMMASKRFCPGGRVLAGAGTSHGNVLNCFVQGATAHAPESFEGIMEVARKLALVTKVGGGNGVNLDPYVYREKPVGVVRGIAYMDAAHPDVEDFIRGLMRPSNNPDGDKVPHPVRNWTRVIYGDVGPELTALARRHGVLTVPVRPDDVIVVADDMGGIMDAAAEAARLALAGEEPRVDFSQLRPEGAEVKSSGGTASGPVSYLLEIYDNFLEWANRGGPDAGPVATLRYVYAPVLRVVRQGGTRRGAGMATIDVAHPDVLDFLTAKDLDREAAEGDISTFNISILATDAFVKAIENNELWPVRLRPVVGKYYLQPVEGEYTGEWPELDVAEDGARPVPVYEGGVPARWIWHEVAWHAWATGEPGLIFIDRVNEKSALKGLGERWQIRATNPCGEIPLTVGEPCDLGALNLAAYVEDGAFDYAAFRRDVRTAVRFLDNVLDVNVFALEDNREASRRLRRLGLGVMGLADALIKMGLPYDSEAAREAVWKIMSVMREEALAASEALGAERGVFPLYAEEAEYFTQLGVKPRRNVAVLTVAPTGTTSMLMGVSSGIEPVFSPFVWRRIGGEYKPLIHPLFQELMEQHPPYPDWEKDGSWDWDKLIAAIQENHGSVQGLEVVPESIRAVFKCAHDVSPLDHVRMQGVVQRAFDAEGYVGNSLSKTINLPNEASVEDVEAAYTEAYRTGCKGVTVYRDGSRDFQVLSVKKEEDDEASSSGAAASEAGEASPKAEPVAMAPGKPVYERPARLFGFTDMVKLTSSEGSRHSYLVTVNMAGGHPIEVIITSGKAGDEANADSEALGRVVSIALQYGVPPEAIVKTLRGINGGLYGNYHKRFVASKADLIAVALESIPHFPEGADASAETAPVAQEPPKVKVTAGPGNSANACPECGAPLKVEDGCLTCEVCGYSKCG